MANVKRTPLYETHKKLGAKMIDFAGWELPVYFKGIIEEHEQTRKYAGLFDVSHMGEIIIYGRDSLSFLQSVTTNDVQRLSPGKVQYAFMCNEHGGTMDDFLIYMLDTDRYMLVVNASNTKKDLQWLQEHALKYPDVAVRNDSRRYALLALQGPMAVHILQKITKEDISEMKPFTCKPLLLHHIHLHALVSRTGYTGEDGFELYVKSEDASTLWYALLAEGKEDGIVPAGLGARDTLRLEAGLPLYGQELTETISPFEAGMGFAVKLANKTTLVGYEALSELQTTTLQSKIVGIEMVEKGIPRTNYPVLSEDGTTIGTVTSGSPSPTLHKNIGLAHLKAPYYETNSTIFIQIRKRAVRAKVVSLPFYHRAP